MNATLQKFGHPRTRVAETAEWTVLVRPQQPTLGSLVLVARAPATAFGALPPAAFADLGVVVPAVERMLRETVGFLKINYLMLMMVDPDVHLHVLPRYAGTKTYAGAAFPDEGWPGPPDLARAVQPDETTLALLTGTLGAAWRA
jgi:diadenosine tetraphosphate (Ap4A) HIT family hydrolase